MKLTEIYEGWKNKLLPAADMKNLIEDISNQRKLICDGCEWQSTNRKIIHGYKTVRPDVHCVNCGCTLDDKRKCLSCSCPLKKWVGVMEQEQFLEIQTELNNGKGSNQED